MKCFTVDGSHKEDTHTKVVRAKNFLQSTGIVVSGFAVNGLFGAKALKKY